MGGWMGKFSNFCKVLGEGLRFEIDIYERSHVKWCPLAEFHRNLTERFKNYAEVKIGPN